MKYFKISLLILIIIFLIIALNKSENTQEVCFNDNCFIVEVADSQSQREAGLIFKESLRLNEGMLFVFDESGNYPFWMKNTLIHLDIIWMDEKFNVVYIKNNALPCESDPCPIIYHEGFAKYVIEINSGLAEKYKIENGTKAEFININYG